MIILININFIRNENDTHSVYWSWKYSTKVFDKKIFKKVHWLTFILNKYII